MNTLKIEKELSEEYNYKPLPKELSAKYRELFTASIPAFLKLNGDITTLLTAKGTPICNGYERIVVGDYGAFIEFNQQQSCSEAFFVMRGQEYRINDPQYSKTVKYEWWTVYDGSNIKIYKQTRSTNTKYLNKNGRK